MYHRKTGATGPSIAVKHQVFPHHPVPSLSILDAHVLWMAPSPKPRTSTWAKPIAGSAYQAWRKPLAAGAAGLAFYSGPCLADGAAQEKGLEDGKVRRRMK